MNRITSSGARMRATAEALRVRVRRAEAATAELLSSALDLMAPQAAAPARDAQARRVRDLIAAQAWTEAALALVALDRARALRRLVYDDGDWHCRIGSQWPVPEWLDDAITFSHAALPLAILGAALDAIARGHAPPAPATAVPPSRFDRRESVAAVCADNYA
jgi:hypothetical protein